VALLLGCGESKPVPDVPEDGGTLRIAVPVPLDFLTPVRSVEPTTEQLMQHVTPPLGRVTEQGDIQWLTARAPGLLQPGLLFRLRPVFWQDGKRVTAHDFALTAHVMLHPGAPGHERSRFGLVRDVIALDDTTLYFDLLEFSRQRWRDALLGPLPAHILGPEPDPRSLNDWPVTRKPLACGPFAVVESSSQRLVLARNARSGWPPARLDRVEVLSLPMAEAVAKFRAGDIDVIDDLAPGEVESVRKVRGARVLAFVGASYVYVGWNLRDARFADLEVRRAIALGTDIPRLVRDLTFGQGDLARGPLVPALGVADTTAILMTDVRAARAGLDRAGWRDANGDGVRERGGAQLAFHLLAPAEDPLRCDTAKAVADELRALGIQVSVRIVAEDELYTRLGRGEFEAYVGKWFPHLGGQLESVWHSEETDAFNYGGFSSRAVDSILSRLRLEQPGPSEMEWLLALQRQVYSEQPYLFLFQDPRFAALSRRVQGARPTVLSTFWNLPEWWVPRRLREES